MFDGLKKWFDETVADVNPWDGGKTGATVRAARAKVPPAQTISRQPQQKPYQSQVGQFGLANKSANPRPLSVQTQTPKLPTMNPKPQVQSQQKQQGLDIPKAIGEFGKGVVNSIGDSIKTVGNAYGTGISYAGDELSGENDRRQQEILNRMKSSFDAQRKANSPTPLSPEYRAKMQRLAQGEMNMADTLKQQQRERVEQVRKDNDPLKVAGAGINLVGTVAAPGAGKITSGITKVASPYIRAPIAKVAGAAAEGGVYGAGFGAANQLQQTGSKTTPEQLRDASLQGAAMGAAFGGAVPVVAGGAKAVINKHREIAGRPGVNPQSGFAKVPFSNQPMKPSFEDNLRMAGMAPGYKPKIPAAMSPEQKRLVKQEIDAKIYDENPKLMQAEVYGNSDDMYRPLKEGGAPGIPRIHVDDLRHHLGSQIENIPVSARRRTGDRDVDLMAARAGFNDVDEYLEAVNQRITAKQTTQEASQQLKELRNNPDVVAGAIENIKSGKTLAGIEDAWKETNTKHLRIKGQNAQSAEHKVPVSTHETRRRTIEVNKPRGKITNYVAVNTLDNNNKPTYELVPMDDTKHTLTNGMVTDKNGKPVGSFLGVDETGQQYAYIEGRPVNISGIMGDVDAWGNMNKASWDMNRLIEANAPDQRTARKVQEFTTVFKDKQEAHMKLDLAQRRMALAKVEADLDRSLPGGISKDQLSQDLFRAMEGKVDVNELYQRYGNEYVTQKMAPAIKWARSEFDDLLNKTNNVLKRNGFDEIPRRDNYITHIQEDPTFWQKVGIGIQDLNPLGGSISSDINPGKTRAGIPDEIVGQTANTSARKRWNPFAQERKGEQTKQDFFGAIDAYYEPMMFNQYMTPAASRARVVERAFRTHEKAKALQFEEMAEILGLDEAKKQAAARQRNNKNYKPDTSSPLVMAWQEYGNMLAGKTNALDRAIIDNGGRMGRALVTTSTKLQGIAGANSIPGSITAAAAQVLSVPQTIARDSQKSVLLAAKDMLGFGDARSKADPMRHSSFMRARYTDAESKRMPFMRKYTKAMSVPMQIIEREAGELSWRSAYHEAVAKGRTGMDAIVDADLAAKKTLAGRGIGDRPIVMNSKAAGVITQFGLEVNNMRLQFWNDFTPAQKAKFVVAAAAMNQIFQGMSGNAPLPDYINSSIDTYNDLANSNDDKKDKMQDDALQGAQRFLGETSKFVPGSSIIASMLMDDRSKEQVFGRNGDLTRFGEPALMKPFNAGVDAVTGVATRDLKKIRDAGLTVAPTGAQAKRSLQGIDAAAQGYITTPDGRIQSVVDQSNPLELGQAATFGKFSLPGQQQAMRSGAALTQKQTEEFKRLYATDKKAATEYFNKTMKKKQDESNRKGTLTDTGDVATASAASADGAQELSATALIEKNKERTKAFKDSLSEGDYAISQLSKADQQKLVKSGAITKEKLDGLNGYIKGKKNELGYSTGEYSSDIPDRFNTVAASVLEDADKSDRNDDWKKKPTANADVKRKLSEWLPNKVDIPSVSNEVALNWAKFKKDEASGKISKLDADDKKRAILRDAFNSQLNTDEQKLYKLSKAKLQQAIDGGLLTQQNVQKALAVEKQMIDAGILEKPALAQKLGLSGSGRGGGKRGGGTKARKGKFEYKLFGFSGTGQSNSKQLYDMLKSAKIKQQTKKK